MYVTRCIKTLCILKKTTKMYIKKNKKDIQEELSVRYWKTKRALPAFQRQQRDSVAS